MVFPSRFTRMGMEEIAEAIGDFNLAAGSVPAEGRARTDLDPARRGATCVAGDLDTAIADLTAVIERYPKEYVPYELRSDAYVEKKGSDPCLGRL